MLSPERRRYTGSARPSIAGVARSQVTGVVKLSNRSRVHGPKDRPSQSLFDMEVTMMGQRSALRHAKRDDWNSKMMGNT